VGTYKLRYKRAFKNIICSCCRLYFRNSAKPFSRGTFEEKYRIDELGKHVTINGVWNPYSSTDPYNFEKVDDGFDFYKNTTVWFHTPIANLSDECEMFYNYYITYKGKKKKK